MLRVKELNAMLQRLVHARTTYSINVEDKNIIWNLFTGGRSTEPLQQFEGVGARTTIDPDYSSHKYGVPNALILSHEAGHADATMGHMPGVDAAGPRAENFLRTILG